MNLREKAELFMKRFHGRRDVYGRGKTTAMPDGTTKKFYAPVCQNFWSDGCHIKLKDGRHCHGCEIKAYEPVTLESTIKHITGEESQIVYSVKENGKVRFSAVDLDAKPGKERISYTFDDVKALVSVYKEWGLPYAIARSTTNGWHVYNFYSEDVSPAKVRAVIYEAFERVGFLEMHRQGIRPAPECFPKNTYVSNSGLGNGIKPAPIESRFEYERNCYVSDQDTMIPVDLQWEYFAKVVDVTPQQLDQIIEKLGLKVHAEGDVSAQGDGLAYLNRGPRGKWQPPLTGSAEKVLEGCAALRRVKSKCLKGEPMTHHEGFGLFHSVALHTADGMGWFEKYSGWGRNESERKQLEQSVEANYAPWTCKTMQMNGVCVAGTKCFEKKPPGKTVDGEYVVDKTVPEDQWPEPSPIRYAFGAGDDFLKKLMQEAELLSTEADPSAKAEKLRALVDRTQVFDKNQQEDLLKFMVDKKLGRKKDLESLFHKAKREHAEDLKTTADTRDDMILVNEYLFKKLQPNGWSMLMKADKGDVKKTVVLCGFDLNIKECKQISDPDTGSRNFYVGTIATDGREYPFEISLDDWMDNTKFGQIMKGVAKGRFSIDRKYYEYLRLVSEAWALRKGLKDEVYSSYQGWDEKKKTYLLRDVTFDADGVRPNTTHKIADMPGSHTAHINGRIVTDEEFRDLLFHFKADLFKAYPSDMLYTGIAHALMAPLIKLLNIDSRPILFYEGLTGSGKTQMTLFLQRLFGGGFPGFVGWHSTAKYILQIGHAFKDCALVVDDYKEKDEAQRRAALDVIQYSYGYVVRGALKRSGEERATVSPRCLFICSGELFPSHEASLIARTILVDTEKRDMLSTVEHFNRCMKQSPRYDAVLPRFGHYILNQAPEDILSAFEEARMKLQQEVRGLQNADRVCRNLGMNYAVWCLFVGLMALCGAVTEQEQEALKAEHWQNVRVLRDKILERCSEEQNGLIFINQLRELLQSGEAGIRGMVGVDEERTPIIGFMKKDEPGQFCLYPGLAMQAVKKHLPPHFVANTHGVGKQLLDLGYIVEHVGGKAIKIVWDGDKTTRAWVMSLEKLGYKQQQGPKAVPKSPPLPIGSDGIL